MFTTAYITVENDKKQEDGSSYAGTSKSES